MKKIIPILIFLVLGTGIAQAQKPSLTAIAKNEVTAITANTLIEQFNLSEQKAANVTKIMGLFAKMRTDVTNSAKTPEQKAKSIADINDREKANLKNILTAEQFTRYLEMLKPKK